MIHLDAVSQLPKELVVLVISALPVLERSGIPVGIGIYHMPAVKAFALSSVGMMLPVIPILLLLDPVSGWLSKRSRLFASVMERLFEHTRKRHSTRIDRYGAVGLFLLVAAPLPAVTGSWSGALLAYLFGIRFGYAVGAILGGVLVSGVLLAAATLGAKAVTGLVGGFLSALLVLFVLGALVASKLVAKRNSRRA